VVGDNIDPLPSCVQQLTDSPDDPPDLLVNVVDQPDADIMATVVELAVSVHAVPDESPISVCPSTCTPLSIISERSTWMDAVVPVSAFAGCRSGPAANALAATGTSAAFAVWVTVGSADRLVVVSTSSPRLANRSITRWATSRRKPSMNTVTVPLPVDAGGPG